MFTIPSIKAKSGLFIALFFLACALPQKTQAQFWKKLFGDHKKETTEQQKQEEEQQIAPKDSLPASKTIYPLTTKKGRYRVDALLPLNLHQYVSEGRRNSAKLQPLAAQAVNFYEGMRLAAQQLNQEGVPIDLYIQDVGEGNNRLQQLTQGGFLQGTDLLIGFLSSEQLPEIAHFARKKNINFLSVFSPAHAGIKDNPYFILMQPSLETHIEKLVAFAQKQYRLHHPILLYAGQTAVQKESKAFFETALEPFKPDTLSYVHFLKQPESLIRLIKDREDPVIFVNLLSYQEAEQVLQALSKVARQFPLAVFGMPSWKSIPALNRTQGYPHMEVYCSTPFYFNQGTKKGAHLSQAYRETFGHNSPSEMVFRGYEALYWPAYLLKDYGVIFNEHLQDDRMSPFTRFDIKPALSDKGKWMYLENRQLYIIRYLNGTTEIMH